MFHLQVEHVIKEQNMIDAFAMIEDYCYLLIDRVMLLKKDKLVYWLLLNTIYFVVDDPLIPWMFLFLRRECPDELKEAISSLIFASSRCGEFPELQEIRAIFVSRFGREFAACSVELRNNCGVNPKVES